MDGHNLCVGEGGGLIQRSTSMETFMVRIYPGSTCQSSMEFISVEAMKTSPAMDVVKTATDKLKLLHPEKYELAETFCSGGQICKERRLEAMENPVRIQLLWPKLSSYVAEVHRTEYHFFLRRKEADCRTGSWIEYAKPNPIDSFLTTFLEQNTHKKEYPDLCNLPDLNEKTLMDNIHRRFKNGNIYTYVGSILIAVNPFKYYPIYNPKYVKMYQNRKRGELPPHIFAIADAAYHTMLHERSNQCIVISGESGSGKTETTNLLLHQLSALSQRGYYGGGVEQTILGAGPVLEAFGNAKTVHNNNSSRFGKFIQVNYKENGVVDGALVEKYLLEKSRIVSQARGERNYHVFYYLLAGASDTERKNLHLLSPQEYHYLNQSECFHLEGMDGEDIDESHEFIRLKQSMEMVGFSSEVQRRIFGVLAVVLQLGNMEFKKKKDHTHHEAVTVKNMEVVHILSSLLQVKESTLLEALTKKKTMAGGESVVMNLKMAEALATRDALTKCLYGALFDWIVLQVNHALITKRETQRSRQGNTIGVLDIFGFEDFEKNSFEQFCINYANEHLHYYFNQHIFKFEQEEYLREGIQWKNIEFIDNTACLDLFSRKRIGLHALLDEECSFPGATSQSLLTKFHQQHQNHPSYEAPQMKESSFHIVHYAGKVKYMIEDFREKNSDLMRHDIVVLLKNSQLSFVRELVGYNPVAVLRWAILRAFFRAFFAFREAGRRHRNNAPPSIGSVRQRQSQWGRAQSLAAGPDVRNFFQVAMAFSVLRRIQSTQRHSLAVSRNISAPKLHVTDHDQQITNMMGSAGMTSVDLLSPDSPVTKQRCVSAPTTPVGSEPSVDPLLAIGNGEVTMETDPVVETNGTHFELAEDVSEDVSNHAMERASKVKMKSKSFRPKNKTPKHLRDLKAMKTLTDKVAVPQAVTRGGKGKSKPPSVSAQFNYSLHRLMETLNQGNPLFIRCIKSNAEKAPCKFDESMVMRQLRYTGMLATVKIRQSGYNYRLTFEEFIHQYKVLLVNGGLSSRHDIHAFLEGIDLNHENYQLGGSKVFLRETDKLLLDDLLHQAIMRRVICIQRWMKMQLERKRFLRMRSASIVIQATVRRFLAQRSLRLHFEAILLIQRCFRGFRIRKSVRLKEAAVIVIQKYWRGYITRKYFQESLERQREAILAEQAELVRQIERHQMMSEDVVLHTEDTVDGAQGVGADSHAHHQTLQVVAEESLAVDFTHELHSSASDEGVLTKESSSEDILSPASSARHHRDSESSGIQDESDPDMGAYDTASESSRSRYTSVASVNSETSYHSRFTSHASSVSSLPSSPCLLVEPCVPEVTPSPSGGRVPPAFKEPLEFPPAYLDKIMRPKSRVFRDHEKAHSVAVSGLTQQPGPKDLELHLGVLSKSMSQDYLQTYTGSCVTISQSQRVSAPLAHQESFNDTLGDEEVFRVTIAKSKQGQGTELSQPTTPQPEDLSVGHAAKSPLHKQAKHLFKNFMPELSQSSQMKSRSLLSVGKSSVTQESQTSAEITSSHTRTSSFKVMKSSTSSLLRQGSQSLKLLLRHDSKKSKKTEDYDSDDSQPDDTTSMKSEKSSSDLAPSDRNKHHKRPRRGSKKRNRRAVVNETTPQPELVVAVPTSWNVASTSQQKYPTHILVTNSSDLHKLSLFCSLKVQELYKDNKRRDTISDKVFKAAMREFSEYLLKTLSVQTQSKMRYDQLMNNYENILYARAKAEGTDESFPVTMGINAFRGVLDEFKKKRETRELPEVKEKKRKKKDKDKDVVSDNGHSYVSGQHMYLATFCEQCGKLIFAEKAYVCTNCRYTVHKKCYSKSTVKCTLDNRLQNSENLVIGAPLSSLVNEQLKVPGVVDRLIAAVELEGLHTEGLYRKAGAAAKVKQLIKDINADLNSLDFTEYPIHVLTAVIKTFFRELPQPLLTFDLYEEFCMAGDCGDANEQVLLMYSIIEKLPPINYDLLERIIFHLANVALNECSNKMSALSLAIIFAPSILRTSRQLPAQESICHIPKQTRCVQVIIEEQMVKIQNMMADIKTLDSAAATAHERLSQVQSTRHTSANWGPVGGSVPCSPTQPTEEEELMLHHQLQSLQQERDHLTEHLAMLECRQFSSSEEDLLGSVDGASMAEDDVDRSSFEECALTFDHPASPAKNLHLITKRRAPLPRQRRRPTLSKTPSVEEEDDQLCVPDNVSGAPVSGRPALTIPGLQQVGEEVLV